MTVVERMHYEGKVSALDIDQYLKEKWEAGQGTQEEEKDEPRFTKEEQMQLLEEMKNMEQIEELQEEAKEMLADVKEDYQAKKTKADEIKHLIKQEVLRQDEARQTQLNNIREL